MGFSVFLSLCDFAFFSLRTLIGICEKNRFLGETNGLKETGILEHRTGDFWKNFWEVIFQAIKRKKLQEFEYKKDIFWGISRVKI